jgi:ectoine hydroxylase-related dioxygenase (phytanoyl-CoA dioxygenase family)
MIHLSHSPPPGADMAESAVNLPGLDDEYPLTQQQIDDFRTNGFVYLPGVCSTDEVAFYREAIVRATYANNREHRPLAERDTFRRLALQTMQIRFHDPAVMAFVTARRFGRIAAQLLEVSGVRIYHDQSLFKEPGGINITPWHQDLYYWPFNEGTVCGMWMPLVDVTREMGNMRFVKGSHLHGYLGDHHISDESQAAYEQWIADHGAEVTDVVPMQAGDATFHHGWCVHGARANHSQTMREAMVVAYFRDGMRVGAASNPAKAGDQEAFLDNLPEGALAAGSTNTLVYP